MDQFQYELKVQELTRCTTKKAKDDFVREINNNLSRWSITSSPYYIKLAKHVLTVLDKTTVGISAMPKNINTAIGNLKYSEEAEKIIGDLPKTQITAGNDYYAFMRSPGIPAYIKLAVLKVQHESKDE